MWVTGTNRERGYTLLELLIVIALIGLLASVGAQAMFPARTTLDRQADQIERSLYAARLQARETGLPVSIACARLSSGTLAAGTDETTGAPCRRGNRPTNSLTFYPDGSASGGTIELGAGDDKVRLSVDWLSGEIARD